MHDLQRTLIEFRDARQWSQYHTPEALARAVMVEAAELNRLYLWGRDPDLRAVTDELADVMIYCLNLCNVVGADAEDVIRQKIEVNAARPVVGDGFGR